MATEIKIPSVGESITEVTIAQWLKEDGDYVEVDESLAEVETDKATVELPAEVAGVLKIITPEGETVPVGAVVCSIDESASASDKPAAKAPEQKSETPATSAPAATDNQNAQGHPSPAAQKILNEKGVDAQSVAGSGKDGRITKGDALKAQAPAQKRANEAAPVIAIAPAKGARDTRREKMTSLRKTIAKRLVEAKNTTAMLTTFNEIDMGNAMAMRKKYKEIFLEKKGVGLGFMSLFTKAVVEACKAFPAVNAQIDGGEIVYHDYVDIGVAVSTPKGLVVPIVRNAENLSLAEIEASIKNLAIKGRDGKITIDEMTGGTFTITNGGVFGSMMSTPILNPPQSAILGMHNIVQRPVVKDGNVVIAPVMYVALSYDHRIVDGRESVGFLKTIKEMLEDPARMLLEV